ncbi:MAG TPA: ankyrin repeat domain-containing protein [Vicinamibacterales bacterium]|nr:ankyrin repeat domain-containing protein [Vicinamibacterales bacterium]
MPRTILGSAVLALLFFSTSAFAAPASKSAVADAAAKGDRAAVRTLIQQKADVNAPQTDGATAMHWAVYREDAELVDTLIRAGADVKVANRDGMTPLMMAALYGNAAIVGKLLKAGADPKSLGPNGETMLMFAARNGNPDAVKVLIEAGVDVNAKEHLRQTTALMWAAEQKHPEAVKVLLANGADPSVRSGIAGTPRNYMANRVNTRTVELAAERYKRAIAAGRTYEEELAVEQREGRDLGGQRGFQPVDANGNPAAGGAAAGGQAPPAAQAGRPTGAAAQGGGQQGGGPRGRGAGQNGAAAGRQAGARQGGARQAGQAGAAAAADAADADADADPIVQAGLVGNEGGGLTALVFAAREGDLDSAKALLDGGANINEVTNYGWTPLLTAVNNRHYLLAKMLLERGADPNKANNGGWTPLYLATDNRNIEGGDYPVAKGDMDTLEFITFLLDKGANPNTPIHLNTLTRTIFTMQWFFEDGATPFVRASQSSDTALMKLLLQRGADPKLKTAYGDTALTACAGIGWVEGVTYERSAKENVEAVRMLLQLGLGPNDANQDGRTPLMGAALKGRAEVIQLLVDAGAKIDQRDHGSRDTDKVGSLLAGHTWEALDYADGLVRTGVQSAVQRPEAAALLRKLLMERGLPVPPPNRVVDSICVVALCAERTPDPPKTQN